MLQITPQMKILVAVAPADFRKGIDGLAQLCKALPSLQVQGLVVGRIVDTAGRDYLDSLRALVRTEQLSDHVRFVTDASSALPWISAADVLVSVSEDEPFGRTVVEALHLGKPVVATRGAGPEEILGDCPAGTLIDATPEALASGLTAWQDAGTRAASAAEARERAGRFSVAQMMTALCAVYRNTESSSMRK